MIILNIGLNQDIYKNFPGQLDRLQNSNALHVHTEWLKQLFHSKIIHEGFNLITPNHLEWFVVADKSEELIREVKSQTARYLNLSSLPDHDWHILEQDEAVIYFYELLCGLHEPILGAMDIMQQVKDGFTRLLEMDCIGSVTNKLFHQGFEMGRYLRQSTDITKGGVALEQAIVELAEKILEKVTHSSFLLIGPHSAMETWRGKLQQVNITRIRIVDPGQSKAIEGVDSEITAEQYKNADVIIDQSVPADFRFSTSVIQGWMHQRKNRPLLIIDLDKKSIFEPEIKKIYNVFHYQASNLENVIRVNLEHRREEVPKIQKHIQKEVDNFMSWFFSDRIYRYHQLVSRSSKMQKIFELMDRVSKTDITILLTGETGTGKELIARTIHQNSTRADRHFVAINCNALPENLLESELFGYIKGAFTGATGNKKGLFEEADNGTLFLDEIGDISPALQVKLLRALQEKEIRRVGSNTSEKIDVRILLATNKDLQKLMEEGKFRSDLYYRINIIQIQLPTLRERREDILPLAEYFLQKIAQRNNVKQPQISTECKELLTRYDWPGNVRELENVMERAFALSIGDMITPTDLPQILVYPHPPLFNPPVPSDLSEEVKTLDELELQHITRILHHLNWDFSTASKTLGIGRTTLWRKIRKYGIKHPSIKEKK